jgi:hypothetical protein
MMNDGVAIDVVSYLPLMGLHQRPASMVGEKKREKRNLGK